VRIDDGRASAHGETLRCGGRRGQATPTPEPLTLHWLRALLHRESSAR
jgi:hypothetical protein